MESEDVAAGRGRDRSVLLVALAGGGSAAVSYFVMWLAARELSTAEATVFLTVLAVLFFSYGLLSGLATEVTRSTAAALRDSRAIGPNLWQVATVAAAACSAAVMAFVLVGRDRLIGPEVSSGDAWAIAGLLGIGVAGYAVHSTGVGALTGRRQWSGTATLIGAETSARLLLTVLAVLLGAGLIGMVAGSASAALAFLAVLVLAPTIRPAMRTPTDCPGRDLSWRIAQSMLAQAAAAALVVGFPVMLAATTGPADYRQAAPLILAISLTRAPLLVPLNAVQGVAVSYLVHAGRRFGRALLGVIGIVTGVGIVGSLLAWAVGPWLMATLFGSDYRVEGWVLGLLTLSATLLAVLTVTGATCQATDRHAVFLAGWVVATSSAALLLLLPGSLEQRSVTALLGGPTLGLAVHVGALVLGSVRGWGARGGQVRVDA